MKKALICGVSGQDGAYLAKLLLDKGYEVIGSSRDAMASSFSNLQKLGIADKVTKVSMSATDFRSIIQVLSCYQVDEVYNLSGQSSVGLSFEQPAETIDSISLSTLNLLEAIRFLNPNIRFYNAGSSECFGSLGEGSVANELTPFRPSSPYAVAKSSAHWLVANYREAYGIYACTGILFNHESPLRKERFVTQKIVMAAAEISKGSRQSLELGNINIQRDWGWAPEYVEAMWLMLQQKKPDDFLIATGHTVSLEYFIAETFKYYELDWRDYVKTNNKFFRPSDLGVGRADPSKARKLLGWKSSYTVDDVIKGMCEAQH